MNRQVYFRPQAAAEAADARKWYDSRQAGLGLKFANAVPETISRIADNPLVFPSVRGEARRAVLRRFPYALLTPARTFPQDTRLREGPGVELCNVTGSAG